MVHVYTLVFVQGSRAASHGKHFCCQLVQCPNGSSVIGIASSATFTDLRNLAVGQKLDSNTISPEYAARCISTTSGNGCCGGSIGKATNPFENTGTTTYQCLR